MEHSEHLPLKLKSCRRFEVAVQRGEKGLLKGRSLGAQKLTIYAYLVSSKLVTMRTKKSYDFLWYLVCTKTKKPRKYEQAHDRFIDVSLRSLCC